ncbi:MAG: N-formylglutamate amidohydrolase [Candidatus Binatia bacterium]
MSVDALLSNEDPAVFEIEGLHGRSPFVLTCDHGGRRIPRKLGKLGLSDDELATHVAWDIGVADLGRRLAARLDAFLISHNYSRLVIDMNRPPGTPDSIITLSERTRVPANEGLTPLEARQRHDELFEPYHRRIADELDEREARGLPTVLVALHSFTPVYKDDRRLWHAGVLYGRDSRVARPMLAMLRADESLVVGDNEPYRVTDASDYTVVFHGERRGLPHVELEIRQDLLLGDGDLGAWTERLAAALEEAARHVLPR